MHDLIAVGTFPADLEPDPNTNKTVGMAALISRCHYGKYKEIIVNVRATYETG
jgi:hypothetical protein